MKCNWCPNEIEGYPQRHGDSYFCSKKCLNQFYEAYPNQKIKDDKGQKYSDDLNNQGCLIFVLIIIVILGVAIFGNVQNTTGELVPETDVEQVSETDVEQGYETEIYPEENYEPISETNSEKIIKRYDGGWYQCDANNTISWVEYTNDGGILDTYILQNEDDNYFYMNTLDGVYQLAIPKTFGMSYFWSDSDQKFVDSKYIYNGNY
jgi:hypothetical protein